MMTLLTQHPSADQLHAFGRGELPPEVADAVERHVAECASCCRALEEAPGDTFEGRLRQARQGTPQLPPELAEHPRYRVLGLGGMGAVYRAEHRHMERLVALKVIHPGLMPSPATVQRFRQEVRAAARLQHPNIVTAHDADEAGGLHFLVMEHVQGRSLADLVRERGPLPIGEACEYIRQAALGLQHANEQGMVHRDIKPHNLMVTPAGQVKILDFGLARRARGAEEVAGKPEGSAVPLTGAGAVLGSADYIAPEQAADPRTADIRADIYSLGCTLYFLLAGSPPFPEGTVQDKLARHAHEPLPALLDVPGGLAALLARMTAKEPAERPATPAQVAEALAPFSSSAAPAARGRNRRPLLIAGLVLAATLFAGAIAMRVTTDRGEIVVETDDKSLKLTVRKSGEIIRIRDPRTGQAWDVDTKNYQLAAADQPDGLAIDLPGRGTLTLRRKGGGTVTLTTTPREDIPPPIPEPTRLPDAAELAKRPNAADALKPEDVSLEARAYIGDGDPARVPPGLVAVLGDLRLRCPGGADRPALTPDGKLVLVIGGPGLLVFDAVTGHRLRSIPLPDFDANVMDIVVSPDQRSVALTGGKIVDLRDLGSGKRLHKLTFADLPAGTKPAVFSPDSKYVAVGSDTSKQVRAWEVSTGRLVLSWDGPLTRPNELPENIEQLAFSADGALLAVCSTDDDLRFFERRADGRFHKAARDKRLRPAGRRLAFSPDGKALAVFHYAEHKLYLCDARGNTRFTFDCGICDRLLFTADSKSLIAARGAIDPPLNWSISLIDVATGKSPTDSEALQIGHSARWSISADGRTVAAVTQTYDTVVRIFDVATGKQRLPGPGPTRLGLSAFSPDGRYLVSCNSGPVQVWDLATGRVAATWDVSAGGPLLFSGDGRLLTLCPWGGSIELWRFPEGKKIQTFRAPDKDVWAIALSRDGSRLAVGAREQPVWVYRTDTGKRERELPQQHEPEALVFSPDGRFLLSTTSEAELKIWDLAPGAERQPPRCVEAWADMLAFLPDGRTVAGMDIAGIWLRDGVSGALKQTFAGPRLGSKNDTRGFGSIPQVFGPGGHLVASGNPRGGPLTIWQLGSNPLRQRDFHLIPPLWEGHVRAIAFSPDGRYVAATHPDGIICILRLAERGRLPELPVWKGTELP